jgi:hypothetical protein
VDFRTSFLAAATISTQFKIFAKKNPNFWENRVKVSLHAV